MIYVDEKFNKAFGPVKNKREVNAGEFFKISPRQFAPVIEHCQKRFNIEQLKAELGEDTFDRTVEN
jgi:hypothetical protein